MARLRTDSSTGSGAELVGPCAASPSRTGAGLAGCRVTAGLLREELVSGAVLERRQRETGLQYAALQDSLWLADLPADGGIGAAATELRCYPPGYSDRANGGPTRERLPEDGADGIKGP